MHPDLSSFYLEKPELVKSCLLALRELVLKFDADIKETKKYGMPCYLLQNKPFCYIWTDKKTQEPYLLIVEGHQIQHSALIQGDRKRMKILPVNPHNDLDIKSIKEVFDLAKNLV
ncbi:MAG: DUF1801 domain-containing protein [Reichenbachiella sp.]|uniref:DUF1801 domain-containing protein n=1 Tax=Reichenbachiella sp. TaxID=2184521 RepID=UPI00329A7A35